MFQRALNQSTLFLDKNMNFRKTSGKNYSRPWSCKKSSSKILQRCEKRTLPFLLLSLKNVQNNQRITQNIILLYTYFSVMFNSTEHFHVYECIRIIFYKRKHVNKSVEIFIQFCRFYFQLLERLLANLLWDETRHR